MTTWTGQAHLLADAIREPGFAAAGLCASAWSARVDPGAIRGLVGAAMTLTGGEAGSALWAPADACPDDRTLLAAAEEIEGVVAELLRHATMTAQACRARWEDAAAKAAAAHAALASGHVEAQADLAAARAELADLEAALEVVDETGTRLAHAADCLRRLPDDLAAVYEVPYQHRRERGPLPRDGEFLTGTATASAA